jgi:hypothetical protein
MFHTFWSLPSAYRADVRAYRDEAHRMEKARPASAAAAAAASESFACIAAVGIKTKLRFCTALLRLWEALLMRISEALY